jgi:hypothetical protein
VGSIDSQGKLFILKFVLAPNESALIVFVTYLLTWVQDKTRGSKMKTRFSTNSGHRRLTKTLLGLSISTILLALALTTTFNIAQANAVVLPGAVKVLKPTIPTSKQNIQRLSNGVLITPSRPVSRLNANGAPVPGHMYTFKIEYVKVINQRSLLRDTDHVTANVLVGGLDVPETNGIAATKELGDVGKGVHSIQLTLPPVFVPDSTPMVRFSYNILNAGGWKGYDQYVQYAESGLALLGPKGAIAAGGMKTIESAIKKYAPGLLPGGCDGLVAINARSVSPDPTVNPNNDPHILAAYMVFAPWELAQGTDNPAHIYTETDHTPGTDSPHGCGANSSYDVVWTVTRSD